MIHISRRAAAVAPFLAMDVMAAAAAKARRGEDVVRMEVGQPSAPAPRAVIAATHRALELGRVPYTEALGMPALRERIARDYRERHGLSYGVPTTTALRFEPEAIVINSFSKYHCMTGWRVGWMVVPDALVRPIERLAQNLYISAPYLSQVGALAAFEAIEELDAVRDGYAKNRALLLDAFPGLGLGRTHPVDGAFYLYADVANLTDDATAFCRRMLDEAGVAATPGLDFDRAEGRHHVRFSFAGSEAECREAVVRLRNWLG